jgi:hypothetical protein
MLNFAAININNNPQRRASRCRINNIKIMAPNGDKERA